MNMNLVDPKSLQSKLANLYKAIVDYLGFYKNPKKYLLHISEQKPDIIVKKFAVSFIIIESLILSIASVLIDNFKGSLGKVPGLLFIDSLYSLPLILIVALSLKIAKVPSPLKKSFASILFSKIFLGVPVQLSLILFVSSEDYAFYIIFWVTVQLIFVFLLVIAPLIFCARLRQVAIVVAITIVLFSFYVFIISTLSTFGPSKKEDESLASRFDPIYAERESLIKRGRYIETDELSPLMKKAERFLKDDIQGDPARNLEEFREDAKFYIANLKEKVRSELGYFIDEKNYRFKTNKRRYSIYVSLLEESMNFLEKYYRALDYYRIRIDNLKTQKEIDELSGQINKYEDLGAGDKEEKLIYEEIKKKGLGQELLILKRVTQRKELQ